MKPFYHNYLCRPIDLAPENWSSYNVRLGSKSRRQKCHARFTLPNRLSAFISYFLKEFRKIPLNYDMLVVAVNQNLYV